MENFREHTIPEKDGLSLSERAGEVLERQNETILTREKYIEKMKEVYVLSDKMASTVSDEEAGEIIQSDPFENAYEWLMIRACTEEDLADAAAFWTAQRDAVLQEKESPEEELAPAA